jgi:hypothetical protein
MATPNIVPRADGEGSLGTVSKQWLDVQAKTINGKSLVTTATADSIPVTGVTGKLDSSFLPSHTHAQGDITDLTTTLSGKAPTSRSVSAGNGLSGGGTLESDLSIAMGTPSTCSPSTENTVTADSHTHALSGVAEANHTHSEYIGSLADDTAPALGGPLDCGVEPVLFDMYTIPGTVIDIANGQYQKIVLSSSNIVVTMPSPASSKVTAFHLIVNQGATARTITFPDSTVVKWADGIAPDLSTANGLYILCFVNDGTYWNGSWARYY